ncbi:LuxR family transcriptional regulator [Streptomyces varsoviensis]|uniref:LuxR family transcriptional regulator n=1 Tax=Streptomyces varsoviensis TaxID=67373 RepID=A0ABR5J889_9ACTN|nr:LuxR family transcriptional regulator [Streptomyces varsoviensis]
MHVKAVTHVNDAEAPTTPAVRLLLVDDDPLVRAGLRLMLGGAADLEIVAEASDGGEVLPLVDRYAPDVVLMDIRMPTVDGLAATEALRRRPRSPQVIVLTTFHADEQVLRALRAGAAGFVLKDTPPARRTRARTLLGQLNDREREVAVAVGQGKANAEIGAALFMSVATVKTHVSRILAKLDLSNRVQIALLAHDAGLLDRE